MAQTLSLAQARQQALQHYQAGQHQQAAHLCADILRAVPGDAETLHLRGVIAIQQKQFDQAIQYLQEAIQRQAQGTFYHSLGNAWLLQKHYANAASCFKTALEKQPELAMSYYSLAICLYELGQMQAAYPYLLQAEQRGVQQPRLFFLLGQCLFENKQIPAAKAAFEKAYALNPHSAEICNGLGAVAYEEMRYTEANRYYQQGWQRSPQNLSFPINLSMVSRAQGDIEQALHYLQQALQRANLNDKATIYHSLLLTTQYTERLSRQQRFALHKEFDHVCAQPLRPQQTPHTPVPSAAARRLRIGYVSEDLRQHSVAYFMHAILAAHDHGAFEIFIYYTYPQSDEITAQLRPLADHWCDCADLSQHALSEKIRADKIDILIDLMGHTGNNRLLTFARKPAPIQIAYLGYSDTTGLTAMDYRLTDHYVEPEGEADTLSSESLLRLAHSYFCYTPPDLARNMPVQAAPCLRKGHMTFGCFNNYTKITDEVLAWWATLLRQLPDAQLWLKNKTFADPASCDRVMQRLVAADLPQQRLHILPVLTTEGHYTVYREIDIALDTYPYHGATTTCEALWMGVPVISLPGQRHVSRMGLSVLTAAGLEDWIAESPAAYIDMACQWAKQPQRLQALRQQMRPRLLASPLMDGVGFTRDLETHYRHVWQHYCRL